MSLVDQVERGARRLTRRFISGAGWATPIELLPQLERVAIPGRENQGPRLSIPPTPEELKIARKNGWVSRASVEEYHCERDRVAMQIVTASAESKFSSARRGKPNRRNSFRWGPTSLR